MIVKNEHETIPLCLKSVRGLFDEIVVVDTGSTDRTKEIAREFGARVFDFVWVDDFAAARNAALARATGDYAFWLDADDVVDPDQREKLAGRCLMGYGGVMRPRTLFAARAIRGRMGMAGRRWWIISGCFRFARTCGGRTGCTSRSCRPLRRVNVPVRWTDVTVRHTGYTDPVATGTEAPARLQDLDGRAGRGARRSLSRRNGCGNRCRPNVPATLKLWQSWNGLTREGNR